MENKIIKTKLVEWEKLSLFQPASLKKMSKSQIDKLKASFKNNGFKSPFYVWEDKNKIWCLDGHTRIPILKLLREEGVNIPAKLSANFIQCKDKKDAKKAVLIYNSHYADIQQEEMFDFIKDMSLDDIQAEIDITGIDFDFMAQDETENDDEVPEEVEAVTKLGDLWELGKHRVLCGDSTKEEDVERLIDGQGIDMVFTDPPYGMDAVKNSGVLKGRYKEIIGDSDNTTAIKSFNQISKMRLKRMVYWGANYYPECLPGSGCWVVWDKNNGGSDQADAELAWTNFKGVVRKYVKASEKKDRVHPTQKPIDLITWVFENWGVENSIILDVFLGSGSTLIASEKTDRICYGMELDPHYCDIIANRYKKWCIDNDKKYSIKLNGKKYTP